jgi:uncharacterized protein involved in exopolysaccharide biosynthesis
MAFLKSNAISDALIEKFKLQARYEEETIMETRKQLASTVRITSGKNGLMSIEVDDKDPQFAANLANAYIDELSTLIGRLAVTEAQQRRLFFEKQLTQAKDKLTAAEIALKSTGVSDSVLKSSPTSAVAAVASLKAQVTAQEVKVGSMRGYLAESAPEFKQAMNDLNNLRAQLEKQAKQDRAEPKAEGTAAVVGKDDYITNYRNFKYYETLFELFGKQYELARVDESREGAVIQVLDVAQPPERKSKPKKALIAVIATLATGFLLLLYVFVRQAVANASRDGETAAKMAGIRSSWHRALGKTT